MAYNENPSTKGKIMPINFKTLAIVATAAVSGAILYAATRLVEAGFEALVAMDQHTH